MLVDGWIEQALAPAFDRFPITGILGDVGDNSMVKADFASRFGIKGTVCIEVGSLKIQSELFHELEGGLEVILQFEGIVMIARYQRCGRDDIALPVCDGQQVRGLGAFAPLIGDRFAAVFGDNMAAIQIEFR